MTPAARISIAFVTAPIVATAVVWALVALTSEAPPVGFLVAAATIAIAMTVVLGIPAFLMTRSWRLKSPLSYGIVGAVIGLIPAALLAWGYPETMLAGITLGASAAGGLAFGLVAGLKSNNRSERPHRE